MSAGECSGSSREETRQTPELADLVEVLFGTQLGGGTDINQALAYCEQFVQRPNDTILVLVSDPMEGGDERALCHRAVALVAAGISVIELLARCRTTAPRRTTTNTRRGSPRWAYRRSPERRTSSQNRWRPRSRSATSARGPRRQESS
jgi:hypothetical protein